MNHWGPTPWATFLSKSPVAFKITSISISFEKRATKKLHENILRRERRGACCVAVWGLEPTEGGLWSSVSSCGPRLSCSRASATSPRRTRHCCRQQLHKKVSAICMQLALSLLASSFIHSSKFLLYLSWSLYCPDHDDLLLLLSAAHQLLEDLSRNATNHDD